MTERQREKTLPAFSLHNPDFSLRFPLVSHPFPIRFWRAVSRYALCRAFSIVSRLRTPPTHPFYPKRKKRAKDAASSSFFSPWGLLIFLCLCPLRLNGPPVLPSDYASVPFAGSARQGSIYIRAVFSNCSYAL